MINLPDWARHWYTEDGIEAAEIQSEALSAPMMMVAMIQRRMRKVHPGKRYPELDDKEKFEMWKMIDWAYSQGERL